MPNLLAQQPRVPSIAKAAGNALAMRSAQENIQGAQNRNILAEKQLAGYDESQAAAKIEQGYQTEARAISTALKAGNTEQATGIYKSLGGLSDMGISIVGDDVSIDYGQSTITGPSAPVVELMEQVGNDPTWMTDPEKAAKSRAWMAARGISFKMKDKKEGAASQKTYSKKNPDGSVRTVKNVKPGSEQEKQLLDSEFVEGSQTIGAKISAQERIDNRSRSNTDKLSNMANEDPNKFYTEQNYRQNDDGSLYLDPVTDLPVKLMPFFKATGKRGNIKAMQGLGEQWDDAKELQELLSIPKVQENLSKANADGIWDKVSGKWSNTVNKWMQDKGIGGNSNTATAIARIQKIASEERKLYMGTAVTDNEMKSALAWMPSAGDSYESMVNKTALMGKEAEQAFRRWIDIFSKDADMSPFYKAFGIDRFTDGSEQQPPEQEAPQAALEYLSANPQFKDKFQEKYGYLPEGI